MSSGYAAYYTAALKQPEKLSHRGIRAGTRVFADPLV